MKILPAVPLSAAGAKNLDFFPKNQFFTIKNFIFSDFGGGAAVPLATHRYGPDIIILLCLQISRAFDAKKNKHFFIDSN